MLFGLTTLGFMIGENARRDMSLMVFCCLTFFLMSFAALIACYGETKYNDEALQGEERALFKRVKQAQLPHIAGMLCAVSLFPVLYSLSKQYWHTSLLESWVIGLAPSMVVVRLLQILWPVAGVSDVDSRRLGLLTVDRHRRRQAQFYVVFAVLCLVYILMWVPQLINACENKPVFLDMFDGVGVPTLTFLLFLAGPSLLGGQAALRHFPEDETLIHFRNIAYRNGFFVMALGMIMICDLMRQPPRISIVLVPMVLELAIGVGFVTMAVLEFRSGTFKDSAEERALLG
jgi:hypothetical protein